MSDFPNEVKPGRRIACLQPWSRGLTIVESMSPTDSVTQWLGRLKDGDQIAAQKLWERYFHRLVGLARTRLQGAIKRSADEEDVAVSAFDSFFRGAVEGRFPQLNDRNNLWNLLVTITVRKALHFVRDAHRQKRGGGQVLGESALLHDAAGGEASGLEQVLGREPSPEFAAQVADECRRLLDRLGDSQLQKIALCKMEGYTTAQIASQLGRAVSTIERKLWVIRSLWAEETSP